MGSLFSGYARLFAVRVAHVILMGAFQIFTKSMVLALRLFAGVDQVKSIIYAWQN